MNPEPTPDQELSDVLQQIQALSGAPAAVVTQQAESSNPSPDAPSAPEAQSLVNIPALNTQPTPSTPIPPHPQGTPNVLGDAKTHDVVQVNCRDSEHHGSFFTIGDIKEGWVHGYRLTEHGGKDFITVKTTEVHRIGPAKVRSSAPCSRQWNEQHGRER